MIQVIILVLKCHLEKEERGLRLFTNQDKISKEEDDRYSTVSRHLDREDYLVRK